VTPANLEELYDLLRIPSVSADPSHAGDVRRAGEWVRDLVRSAKGGSAELIETDTQPLLIGEIPASNDPESAPTVLVYGHFDVQPPAPLELWDSDPFEPEVRDDWLFARGVADDKGQLYAVLRAAVDLAEEGALPVNIRVASDGEEEIGGSSVVDWVLADERGADEFWLRTTAESSVDVNGILGGKPGLKNTTVVTSAQANFTVRLAPGQDVETIRAAVERLVREAAPEGAEIELKSDRGTPASVVDPKSAPIQLGLKAFEKVFGREPLLIRGGGTLPIMAALTERGIPVVLTGVALPESSVHSPNEKLPVEYLTKARDAARELYLAFADLPRSG